MKSPADASVCGMSNDTGRANLPDEAVISKSLVDLSQGGLDTVGPYKLERLPEVVGQTVLS